MVHKILAPAAIICAMAAAPAEAASVADWRYDLDLLVRHVRLTHPDPFNQVGEHTFLRAVQALEEELHTLTEEQRVVRVMAIMAMIGDAHTMIEPRTEAFAAWYPVRLVEFSDGYFITSAHQSVADLAGAQVLTIAGRPVAEIAAAGRDLIPADNEFWRRESLYALHNAGLMRGLGFAERDDALRVRVRLASGRVVERSIAPMRAPEFQPGQASLDWRFGRTEVTGPPVAPLGEWVTGFRDLRADAFRTLDRTRPAHLAHRTLNALPLPEHDAYYIMINIWGGTPQETIPEFFARAMREVDQQRPRRLILDLRLNVGGDGSNAWPVIQELLARKHNQPWREFYVLTSGRTYSASINFMGPLLQNVPVTIIGEPMGGALNLYGDYSTFPLERIGMELRVSALYHQWSETTDLRTSIDVDVPAPMSFADWRAGRDPAVDPILAGEEMRAIPLVALQDGGAVAQRVYRERAARFGASDWWAPPTELQLRRVGQELMRQDRIADAVETYRLGAEVRPLEWRAWMNFADALRANGQIAEAIDAYRRCVGLNDPTNFNQERLTALVAQLEAELAQRNGATR